MRRPHTIRPLHRLASAGLLAIVLTSVISGTPYRSLATPASGAPDGGPALEDPVPASPMPSAFKPGGWVGTPSDVAGGNVYDRREFIVTDSPFDDTGADSRIPKITDSSTYQGYYASLGVQIETPLDGKTAPNGASGNYTYPPGVTSGSADIVETRIAADADAWYVLVKFNALNDPSRTALYITASDSILEVHGLHAELDGIPLQDAYANMTWKFVEVRVPRAVFDPLRDRRPVFVGAGLWDSVANNWYQPDPLSRIPLPFYDLAYAPQEDFSSYWNDRVQAADIGAQHFGPETFLVNFDRLVTDQCQGNLCADIKPYGGLNIRVFRSGQPLGEGIVPDDRYGNSTVTGYRRFLSSVQPYAVYAPLDYETPHPLVLLLHPEGGNHMSYVLTAWNRIERGDALDAIVAREGIKQWADDLDAIVAMPFGRGEAGRWEADSEKDVFEVWRDVARHYPVDANRVYVLGVGMGGYGAVRLAHLYPDQFARVIAWGAPIASTTATATCQVLPPTDETQNPVSCPYSLLDLFGNAGNVPLLLLYGALDANAPITNDELWVSRLDQSGTPYKYVVYPTQGSKSSYPGTDYGLVLDWLGDLPPRPDRPTHVTYRMVRDFLQPASTGTASAYWLRDITLDPGASFGFVDAELTDATRTGTTSGPTARPNLPAPYIEQGHSFEDPAATRNFVSLKADGIQSLQVVLDRIGWDTSTEGTVRVDAASSVDLLLKGQFPAGTLVQGIQSEVTLDGLLLHVQAGQSEARITPP